MTSKADKLPLETEPVARDNNIILTLKPVDQTLSRLTQLILIVVIRKYLFLSRYTAIGYPDYVQYTAFVDEIESIFTLKGI